MKITWISPPANMAGGTRVIAIYAKLLVEMGHEVNVVAPSRAPKDKLSRILHRTGIYRGRRQPAESTYFSMMGAPYSETDSFGPVKAVDVPDADAVIATWWETAEWVKEFPSKKGKKFYFIQHHETFDFLPIERVRATYFSPMKKIVVARWLKDVMEREYGDKTAIVVPNSIDHSNFYSEKRSRQIVPTIGTLFHETSFKGFDITLEVIDRLRGDFPSLRVVAFGDSPPLKFANRLDGIELAINPLQSRIREIYSLCDVWLSCSKTEGFNLTAMEAMACRTPVVATRTGWPAEAITDMHNGLLNEVDDVEGLALSCQRILNLTDDAWFCMSSAAHNTVVESNWQQSAHLLEQALSEC